MTIEVIYRVLKTNGELAGEYMDKKLADAHDQKLDCIYMIADLICTAAPELAGDKADRIAERLVDNKAEITSALKKVKGVVKSADAGHSNIKILGPAKQVVNG